MGSLRSASTMNTAAGTKNPARFSLTWKSDQGGHFDVYDRETKKRFVVTQIESMVILEPSLHTATGMDKDGRWWYFTKPEVCNQAQNKHMKIFRMWRDSKNKELMYHGPYKKDCVAGIRWKGVMFATELHATAAAEVGKKGKKWRHSGIVELILPFNAVKNIGAAAQEIGLQYDELDCSVLSWSGETSKEKFGSNTYDYPVVKVEDTALTDEISTAYKNVTDWLDAIWSDQSEMDSPTQPEDGYPDLPEVKEEKEEIDEQADDDLPF